MCLGLTPSRAQVWAHSPDRQAGAVVGEYPFGLDAGLVELSDGSFQEPGGGGGGFVSVYFGVKGSGAVVEGGVDVSVSDLLGGSCFSFAVGAPASSVGDAGQFFDVDVNQLAGPFTLVTHHFLRRGCPVALVEAAQPGVGDDPVNSRGRQPDLMADPGWPPRVLQLRQLPDPGSALRQGTQLGSTPRLTPKHQGKILRLRENVGGGGVGGGPGSLVWGRGPAVIGDVRTSRSQGRAPMGWDDITIPLRLRGLRVVRVLENTLTRLKIEVRSGWSVSWCPSCGHKCSRVHDTRSRPVRDQMMTGRQVTLVWQRRRFVCDSCGNRHLESHPEFEGNLTRRLARQVIADTRVMTISAVARREGLGWRQGHGPGYRLVEPGGPAPAAAALPGAADRRDLHPAGPQVCDRGQKRRHRQSAGHCRAPLRSRSSRVFCVPSPDPGGGRSRPW